MAEVFAAATGAVSIAGFAGQLVQGTTFLYEFIHDFEDAPTRVRDVGWELFVLRSVGVVPGNFGPDLPFEENCSFLGRCCARESRVEFAI